MSDVQVVGYFDELQILLGQPDSPYQRCLTSRSVQPWLTTWDQGTPCEAWEISVSLRYQILAKGSLPDHVVDLESDRFSQLIHVNLELISPDDAAVEVVDGEVHDLDFPGILGRAITCISITIPLIVETVL